MNALSPFFGSVLDSRRNASLGIYAGAAVQTGGACCLLASDRLLSAGQSSLAIALFAIGIGAVRIGTVATTASVYALVSSYGSRYPGALGMLAACLGTANAIGGSASFLCTALVTDDKTLYFVVVGSFTTGWLWALLFIPRRFLVLRRTVSLYSYASLGQLVAQMLSAPPSGYLADAFGTVPPCFASLLVASVVCFTLPWMSDVVAVFVLLPFIGAISQIFSLADMALIVRTLPSARTRIRDMGAVPAMQALGQAIATVYSGVMLTAVGAVVGAVGAGDSRVRYQRLGYVWSFVPMGGVAVIGALLLLPLRKVDAAVHDELEHANTMISVVSAQGSTVTTVADLAAAGASRTSSMSRRRTFCRAHSYLSAEGSVIGTRKYGYEHRRCEGDEDMNVDNSIELVFCVPSSFVRPSASVVQQQSAAADAAAATMQAAASVTPLEGRGCCPICGVKLVDANGDADVDAAAHAAGSPNAPVVLLRVEEQIAFVIKPAGKTAVGDYVGTLQSALRVLLPPTTPPAVGSDAGPLESPMPVTRLEASTTGVTLIARSRRALDELEALASRSELTHCFLALVYGQGKTQLTCVGVHAAAPAVAFEVPVPLRLLASSWVSLEAAAQARAAEREGAPTSSITSST
ncbi:hypothetical protein Ctob_002619 [Chrysochromulina tobinii]|uniref:Uncharacterized protein n=1 Tax=Chrysochromulina tobinii TaxID=1460289 RepID=A0A0M0JMR2_9EUKA|nr:hypothetical protein Ctob_002619 [Chrysochromulina tobinii]|eukprot:KOO27597.1 hypothetical protein Ctob_002619 [Chrysochromulina sp. CCMP291]